MNTIPSASDIHSYEEKLGIVGILLLCLIVGIVIFLWFMKRIMATGASISKSHLEMSNKTVEVLTTLSGSLSDVKESVTEHHRRLDDLLSCPAPKCPAKPGKLTANNRIQAQT
jgi:hypothetical protein